MTKNKSKSAEIQVLDDREHALLRPQIYLGDTTTYVNKDWCFVKDKEDYIFTVKDIPQCEAFYKLYSEIIDNALDEFVKTNGKYSNKIQVQVLDRNHIIIEDNGRGLPTSPHPQFKDKTQFEIAFTHLKAGSNFKKGTDESESDSSVGMNGVGVSLVNIFSEKFIVVTEDPKNRMKLVAKNNMEDVKVSKLSKKHSTGTKVEAIIDMSRFENEEIITKEDVKVWIYKRLVELNTYYPEIKFYFNKKRVKVDLHDCINPNHYRTKNGNKQITLAFKLNKAEKDLSYVNGLNTYCGGTHLNYVQEYVFSKLMKKIKRHMKPEYDIQPKDLQKNLFILMSLNGFPNAKFSTQNKTKLINPKKEIDNYIPNLFLDRVVNNFYDKYEKQLSKVIEELEEQAFGKVAKKQKKSKMNVPKLIDANTKDRKSALLFICEGNSAANMFLRSRDKKIHAVFPLRGKIINAYSKNIKKVLSNKEIKQLLHVIGLQVGQKVKNVNQLRYGKIRILTDADPDGDNITALLCVLFHKYWPELFTLGLIEKVYAPLVVATKGKEKRVYHSLEHFHSDLSYIKENNMATSYYKGLGKMSQSEYKEMLYNPVCSTINIEDVKQTSKVFEILFGDDTNLRKGWLQGEDIL